MASTFERLSAMLIRDYGCQPESLTAETTLETLGIDSLGLAELMFNVEDEFKLTLPPQPVPLPTLADVVAYIDGLVAAQHGTANAASGEDVPVPRAS
jgi:acyl carrier protein